MRIGHGYDLHRLEPIDPSRPRKFLVGGVPLTHDRAPIGHSDADALFHAVTDAILGALALPDIGQLFPDTDPAHEGRDSEHFLREAVRMAREARWRIVNLDATIILERPKLASHKEAIRANLARVLDVPLNSINVKGKTHEKVDAVGEGRAIEVHVLVLLAAGSD